MPEQNENIGFYYIIGSGFFTFAAIASLLLLAFRGSFPELIPVFLIFFISMVCGSCFGFRSDSSAVRYCELLFGFTALFFFREPVCFALIGGFLAGCLSNFCRFAPGP